MSVPDQIAIISDVHANIPALESVLADIRSRGIDTIYNLGDLVGKGGNSDLAIDICCEVCAVTVRGNWDDDVARVDNDRLWGNFVRAQIGEERIAYLRDLPNVYNFWLSGMPVRLFHASAQGVNRRVYAREAYSEHLAMFEETDFTGYDHPAPQMVGYGDIHDAFALSFFPGHRTLFNAGSVGNSLDMPLATYAILGGTLDGRKRTGFSLQIVRLDYDVERAIQDAAEAGAPEVEELAVELRTAMNRTAWRKQQEQERKNTAE